MNDEKNILRGIFKEAAATLVVAAVVGGLGIGISAWSTINDLRYHIELIDAQYRHLSDELETVRKPELRFMATDGEHLQRQVDGIANTIIGLGERCHRCATRLERVEAKLEIKGK